MLFNSFEFALFLPLVVVLYFLLPSRFRVLLLFIASCAFYMAFIPVYIVILFVTILIDYLAAIYIEQRVGQNRKAALAISIAATCAVLFLFKYFNFFAANVNAI